MGEVALPIIQENGHEFRVQLGGDDEIGDFVSVNVLRGDLESTGGPNQADRRPRAGAEFEFQGIFGLRRAIARYLNHRQVGLQIAIEIGDREVRGALLECAPDKERRWMIHTAVSDWQQE